ncbi:MAG: 1-(5-phosphoribosyl)-5-[Clostridia bacterium]|nr:1-(5-phosphoribosyl)-5-[(5-phosphoribosylamino)methylideneamino]imidazole-4-carboxamide isomerase [Clostridia bacterium]MBR2286832.1 1-(5-phosphoribosyl)-5-[(5-phosphoribosylamino)methylideneamino]imidazole-4-carboxamide isomerase [Clostridia bacterium]
MHLYPAIDLMGGKAVRLRQGKRDDVTVFGDPVELAKKWADQGATYLHVVDLDAAFDGSTKELPLLEKIASVFPGEVELGGGLRSTADVRRRMEIGIAICIIGSAACEHPEMVEESCREFPGRIVVGIDAKNGMAAVHGWVDVTQKRATDLALEMKGYGVERIIYTDVARDGMMQGPNLQEVRRMVEDTGMQITGSGGVSRLSDVIDLMHAGCEGAILGRALYEGAIDLKEALERTGGRGQ